MTTPNQPRPRIKRNYWIIGGGAAIAIVWYGYHKSKANSAAAITDPNATDPIDPNTGIPYSQETTYAPGLAGMGYGGGSYGVANPIFATPPTGGVPVTNAQWAQQAESYLTGIGYDPITAAAAIGKYLSGQALSADQYAIVQAAIAFIGPPPGSVSPPIQQPPSGQTTMTRLASPRLTKGARARTTTAVHWTAVPHATNYNVRVNGVVSQRNLSGTSATITHRTFPVVVTVESLANGFYRSLPSNPVTVI